MLDEAFSKSDPQFTRQALQAFRKFGFQLVIVATVQNATTIHPYIDSMVMVSKTEPTGPAGRLGDDEDDLGVHHAAPRDARDGEAGAGRGLMSSLVAAWRIAELGSSWRRCRAVQFRGAGLRPRRLLLQRAARLVHVWRRS